MLVGLRSTLWISCQAQSGDLSLAPVSPSNSRDSEPNPKAGGVRCGIVIPGTGLTAMVDGERSISSISAGGHRLSDRSEGR